jgi:hypothetical protein
MSGPACLCVTACSRLLTPHRCSYGFAILQNLTHITGKFPRLGGQSYYYLKRRLEQWGKGIAGLPSICLALRANCRRNKLMLGVLSQLPKVGSNLRGVRFAALEAAGGAKNPHNPASAPMRWKPVEAAQDESRPPVRFRGIIKTEARQAAEERGDGNFSFKAGKLGSKAKMDAAAERHWPDVFACDIELVRVRVNGWVAIGGPEQAQDCLSLANPGAANRHVLQGCASGNLNRRVVPQELFDGASRQREAVF